VKVAFIGVEEGNSFVALRSLRIVVDQSGKAKAEVYERCPACNEGNRMLWMGTTDAIDPLMTPDLLARTDHVAVIRLLIEKEIAAAPNSVGYPINIIEVEKSGRKWIEQSKVCQ
jgi:hypothetical protein